jgi:hypothetical protein
MVPINSSILLVLLAFLSGFAQQEQGRGVDSLHGSLQQEYERLQTPWQIGIPTKDSLIWISNYSPKQWQDSLYVERILAHWQAQGYLEAEVHFEAYEEQWKFRLEPGPLWVLGGIATRDSIRTGSKTLLRLAQTEIGKPVHFGSDSVFCAKWQREPYLKCLGRGAYFRQENRRALWIEIPVVNPPASRFEMALSGGESTSGLLFVDIYDAFGTGRHQQFSLLSEGQKRQMEGFVMEPWSADWNLEGQGQLQWVDSTHRYYMGNLTLWNLRQSIHWGLSVGGDRLQWIQSDSAGQWSYWSGLRLRFQRGQDSMSSELRWRQRAYASQEHLGLWTLNQGQWHWGKRNWGLWTLGLRAAWMDSRLGGFAEEKFPLGGAHTLRGQQEGALLLPSYVLSRFDFKTQGEVQVGLFNDWALTPLEERWFYSWGPSFQIRPQQASWRLQVDLAVRINQLEKSLVHLRLAQLF